MKKTVVVGVLVTFMSVGAVQAAEPEFLQTAQTVRNSLSASAFSATAQRANPAANVVYTPVVKTVAAPATANAQAAVAITKTLARGLKNDAQVKLLQEFLVAKGFLVATPDGNFGPKTEAAVKKFQSANGVSPLGIVGPKTRALIK